MFCSDTVFSCFKAIERFADRVTGAAGPFFVGLAVVLISSSVIAFFNILQPELPWPWLTTPLCILIATNIYANYYYVCTVSPGFVDVPIDMSANERDHPWSYAPRTSHRPSAIRWSDELQLSKAKLNQCRKCAAKRPERAHHCRICKRCVLKYDHHCPCEHHSVNNERYFVLFMAYLVIGGLCFSIMGVSKLPLVFDLWAEWPHAVPGVMFMLSYVLSLVLCLAVGIMLSWHIFTIMRGETSVEGHDHRYYRISAERRGETFVNAYDLGRKRNLALFFNLGRTGYPWWSLLLPLRTMPYTDGWSWAKRPGMESHGGVPEGEEMTDDEES